MRLIARGHARQLTKARRGLGSPFPTPSLANGKHPLLLRLRGFQLTRVPRVSDRYAGLQPRKEHEIKTLETPDGKVGYWPLQSVTSDLDHLPYLVRVFLENVLRHQGRGATEDHLGLLLGTPGQAGEFPYLPARVILQDFTGVPAVADLAALRSAVARLGGDPGRVNPKVPVDLVIDHSVQVDAFGSSAAFAHNVEIEYQRNGERYAFLRWAQEAFDGFRVAPPGAGIVHQVNLEYLASVVCTAEEDGTPVAYPDTLVGTDSHTTMIGGLGVLGWGVGGIEAEAAMLGEPIGMLPPTVVGVRLEGSLPEGATATDLVLSLTELLRNHGVVGKFVEFHGPGLASLTVADRATIANMSPEYGATEGFFPVDTQTLAYLHSTGREPGLVDLVERYTKEQGLFWEPGAPDPTYDEALSFDLDSLEPALAGPSRPQDRVALPQVGERFRSELGRFRSSGTVQIRRRSENPDTDTLQLRSAEVALNGSNETLGDGSVAIAAITSCTNTSNPSVMVGAGLLARNAVERGLRVSPTVKTSLAPGSPVVMDYLEKAGLLEPLEALGFHLVGFGCTTCIGNSGPLPGPIAEAVDENDLTVAAVLSGNRNFEGRIHPQVKMSFLASPPLVVAYALAGTVDRDLTQDPIGTDLEGNPVYLREIWPSAHQISEAVASSMEPEAFKKRFARIFDGDDRWAALSVPEGSLYEWNAESTYIQEPPFVSRTTLETPSPQDVVGARVLVYVGDSVTTDHISPAGAIPATTPAGEYLTSRGVEPAAFNSYGSRRGNHEVMLRGTFANIRLRNKLADGKEGGYTTYLESGEITTVYEAAERYRASGTPLVVLAGKEYGSGSSRDWAAKGTQLLGVKAVLAGSYERIHRANLVQMGVLPLELPDTPEDLGLDGTEVVDIRSLAALQPRQLVSVSFRKDGEERTIDCVARIDTQAELRYFFEEGILPAVTRDLVRGSAQGPE
jgi:aconitate hydratase